MNMKKILFIAIFGLILAQFASAQKNLDRKVLYKILFQDVDESMIRLENTGSKNKPWHIGSFPIYSFPNEERKGGLNVANKETIYIIDYLPEEHSAYALKKHQRLAVELLNKELYKKLKREHGDKVEILKKDIGHAYVYDTGDLLPNGPPRKKKPSDSSTAGTK
ncbi:hypothetical protein A3A09_02920 [Candidatus Nomurabacteria bacterium RIFCSPLOWO2_01_FULL_42_20]|uniref:Uncharacterized protein n=1 Tax=Candidatus Nomurabacteria bacterium RIFCSPHIGHO2_01_FULL_42_16 TaxID=1801743 RepID=A0A1F6VJ69_9BACT|nr:MAG: hypothetical protein A2824_03025 [Candidatus Nomurabacteria bacterium RIFCSPHIGHO2_01_FULL_42_16]OGI92559.1 MAG: hypothetical protein A3A09_02920 [Candidatus Nomurabacteria bacterium RIFCSPLOWO2_01_FULL_42_20]